MSGRGAAQAHTHMNTMIFKKQQTNRNEQSKTAAEQTTFITIE